MSAIAQTLRAEHKADLLEASQEVKEIMAAELNIDSLELRLVELTHRPDLASQIQAELEVARAHLESLVSPWRR